MIMRKSEVLAFGVVLMLLSLDCTLAMSSAPDKKGTAIEKKAGEIPPPMEDRGKAAERVRKKRVVDSFFKELDDNKDKKVNLDEFLGPMKSRFESIDGNQDGFITRREFEASYEEHLKKKIRSMGGHPGEAMPNRMPPQMLPK